MKVLLMMADAQMHKFYLGSHVRSAREAPISTSTLAALTQDRPDIEYTLIDESVDKVPLDFPADLVGISVLTGTARRAYALADHFRSRGIPVVLGGAHVTLLPDEARQFADSIVIGMAEKTWPQLLADFEAGLLLPEYREPPSDSPWAEGIPTPRWDLTRLSGYMVPHVVHATRGCVHSCDFCSVRGIWKRFQRRPVADVVADIRAIPAKRFVLNDVSPFDDIEYAKELVAAIIPLRKKWGGLATTRITDDPELFDLLQKSGCNYLLIGFESANQSALNRIAKGFNKSTDYKTLMCKMREARIIVQGCFVFGFDHDTTDVFGATVQEVQDLKIDIPRYSLYTPYPGTPLFKRLEAEGRVLSYDWSDYDTMKVVFRPNQMSPAELFEGFRWAYQQTFTLRNILERTIGAGKNFPIAFMGNLTYRLFVKRLQRSRGFEMPLPVRTVPASRQLAPPRVACPPTPPPHDTTAAS
ncbi:MAG: B12-binding domain-containing radical SAM protein [Polyangiaceae bacterium]|jgi:radical SAM superfamily enzyme YgiQ (UPF0313 family)|nr:B12-binding domain-containing radical SAM protein [Polyangiaceae bacterium]